MVKDTFDTIYQEGEDNGHLMVLNLHPWLIGQPFRVHYLKEALNYIMGHEGVWAATGSEIVEWYQQNHPAADEAAPSVLMVVVKDNLGKASSRTNEYYYAGSVTVNSLS
jgi:hypothetical protein